MNLAVADYNGKVRLYIITPTGHTITESFALSKRGKDNAEIPYIEIPCKMLDKIISELRYSHVDLLNLDVENAALVVLKGAKNALERKIISRIKIEIENEEEALLLIELLRTLSYRVFRHGITLYAIAQSRINGSLK